MIGVFVDKIRVGSIMHFPHHKYWAAWSYGDVSEKFKTKKAAVAWLARRHLERNGQEA